MRHDLLELSMEGLAAEAAFELPRRELMETIRG
jgi:hypothetical protein